MPGTSGMTTLAMTGEIGIIIIITSIIYPTWSIPMKKVIMVVSEDAMAEIVYLPLILEDGVCLAVATVLVAVTTV